jgi:hypothetical protein
MQKVLLPMPKQTKLENRKCGWRNRFLRRNWEPYLPLQQNY